MFNEKIKTLTLLMAATTATAEASTSRFGASELQDTLGTTVTEISFLTPSIVNVRHYAAESQATKRNLVVTLAKQDVPITTSEEGGIKTLQSEALTVTFDTATGQVAFASHDGTPLLTEKGGTTSLTARKDGTDDSYRVKQTFTLQSGERLYGLGQLQNGYWNQRGRTYDYMIQGNTSVWIPYIHSSRGYALFWDNPSPTTYKDSSQGMAFESATGYGVDYYFLKGSATDGQEAVRRMRELSGQVPLAPLWAYGFFQSKERYESADETMSVARRYRELQVPLDCVVQDWQYWGGNNLWNAMEFSNLKFSNYQQMLDSLHRMDAHVLISTWANFGPDTKPYAYFKEHNLLMKQGDNIMTDTYPSNEGVAVYDAYSEDARDHYWQFLYDGLVSKGVDAYWLDSSEPDHYQGGTTMEQTFDFVTGMGCTWRSVRNAFPLVHVGGVYDHHRAESALAEKRVAILTRSGYAGMQRYGANTWSGDITASWQTLANQIPTALNYTLCGNPNWNSDTGGFFNGDLQGPGNDEYNELYARWLQFSAFCPMMRSHGAGTDKAIYVWGKRGSAYYDNEEKYIGLRYRLLPYIYSTAWQVHADGQSFMNALASLYPSDAKALTVKDQYLFGQSLMVAPVLKYQATARTVYLPEDGKWLDFWTGEAFEGGQSVERTVELRTLPLYVKAGSILPMARKRMHADVADWDTLQLRIYPGADGAFTLYDDEGDSYRYEQGKWATTLLTWNDATRQLTIGQRQGSYDGMKPRRVYEVVVVDEAHGTADTLSAKVNAHIIYDGTAQTVTIGSDCSVASEAVEQTPDATATETILSLDTFNPAIQGCGTINANVFTPTLRGYGGWWNEGGILVGHYKYAVAELEEPVSDGTLSLRVYPKAAYASAPISATFAPDATSVAVELGNSSYVYGIGLWSQKKQTVKLKRIYLTSSLPDGVGEDAATPYVFTPSNWVTGDAGRVSQRKIGYDAETNTITLKTSGAQNACLQLSTSKSDLYYIDRTKTWLCVKGCGVEATKDASQLWFALGAHVGSVNPDKVFAAEDGDMVACWNLTTWMPDADRVHLCHADNFTFCFGLTPTDGEAVVSDIGFYAEDEQNSIGTAIKEVAVDRRFPFNPTLYDLQGRKVEDQPAKGIYIRNGKKIVVK